MWQILSGALSVSPYIAFFVAVAVCEMLALRDRLNERRVRRSRQATRTRWVQVDS